MTAETAAATTPLLLTGFAPFAGESLNPSALIASALDGQIIGRYRVHSAILPVSFAAAPRELRELLRRYQPQAVVALGQAGGRAKMGLERVALNLIDARIADEDGQQPIDVAVRRGAPAARFARAPIKAMLQAAQVVGWPVEISLNAGSFVCNALYFELLQLISRKPGVRGLFVHVPWLPQQALQHGGPALELETQVDCVRTLLAHLDDESTDQTTRSAGREH